MDEKMKMASAPDTMDDLNQLSLMLFKKPLQDLTDDEYDKLQEYAKEKLAIGGRVGLAEGMMASSNNYKNYVNRIRNAGSIFLGKYSTEAVGDYLAGTNHVLPTAGSAKFSSGLSVYDFYKRISYINLSKKGIETLGPSVITLANFEGLEGHAKSVELRIRRK